MRPKLASYPLNRRLLSGSSFFFHSSISWKTKKKVIASRSSVEAKYRLMAIVSLKLKWLKGLLRSLGMYHPKAMSLYCDSQSAIHISQNLFFMIVHNTWKLIVRMCEICYSKWYHQSFSCSYFCTTC